MLEGIFGKDFSGVVSLYKISIPGTKENRAKEDMRLLIKIGKGQKNEEKIEKIDRDFIEKAKVGLVKLKEAEENQINSHTTNSLEPAPQRNTTNLLNNPTNQSPESLSGKLENPTSSSLGSSKNQNQVH
jgi:hypothetical protein